jgi:capsular polysaccharide biosynthesis protein
MRERRTEAIVRTAHSTRLNVRVFRHSRFEYHIKLADKTYRLPINRYMVHVPDAYYAPVYRFVLDRSTKSVIASDMFLEHTNSALEGFGDTVERFPDGRILIDFSTDDNKINGPVICVSPWGAFSNLIMHVLMGIVHCDDLLGIQYPILVPDDLPVWQRRCLALIGIDEDRMIRVPRYSATHVTEAYVPSKSFTQSCYFGADLIDHGFFFEPNDLKSYSRRVIENLVNLAPEDDDGHRPARVLYIARKDAGSRFTTNEAEAVEALRLFGVRYVLPTELPIATMARAIHQADVVISAHGSAILNMPAARPGTTLIEIDHPGQDWCGRRICQILGYRHVICTRYRGSRVSRNRTNNPVNIPELLSLIKEALSRSVRQTTP